MRTVKEMMELYAAQQGQAKEPPAKPAAPAPQPAVPVQKPVTPVQKPAAPVQKPAPEGSVTDSQFMMQMYARMNQENPPAPMPVNQPKAPQANPPRTPQANPPKVPQANPPQVQQPVRKQAAVPQNPPHADTRTPEQQEMDRMLNALNAPHAVVTNVPAITPAQPAKPPVPANPPSGIFTGNPAPRSPQGTFGGTSTDWMVHAVYIAITVVMVLLVIINWDAISLSVARFVASLLNSAIALLLFIGCIAAIYFAITRMLRRVFRR